MSRFFQNRAAGGFRLDSPVKVPVASEMPRCAPPHTNAAGEEPCQGGGSPIGTDGLAIQFAGRDKAVMSFFDNADVVIL